MSLGKLALEGRWDIDYHLPPVEIAKFPGSLVAPVSSVARVVKTKRDPSGDPESLFKYVDISSIDTDSGCISNPQELLGEEAPSRARKVIHAYDVIVSTCRPTRGAIAVVPEWLHSQIASTAFTILRVKSDVNPFFLHYALRLPSSLEQFRKWSTGSSYPAILDEDVMKTLVPIPEPEVQDAIATRVLSSLQIREKALRLANDEWTQTLNNISQSLMGNLGSLQALGEAISDMPSKIHEIKERLEAFAEPDDDLLEEDLMSLLKNIRES